MTINHMKTLLIKIWVENVKLLMLPLAISVKHWTVWESRLGDPKQKQGKDT